MKIYYQNNRATLFLGDNHDVLPQLSSIDSIVTDPPYGLRFMGKAWDYDVPRFDIWQMVLEVCKPGAHLLSFFGSRTYHRGVVQIEDAGWEIRDSIMWLYGSGFPKSHDVSKAIDKEAGAKRDVIGKRNAGRARGGNAFDDDAYQWPGTVDVTVPATEAAQQWDGWGTALKPAHEPIVLARKTLIGTIAQNITEHSTGAVNIDRCRINPGEPVSGGGGFKGGAKSRHDGWQRESHSKSLSTEPHNKGRWPANVIHDGSDEVLDAFAQFGEKTSNSKPGIVRKNGTTFMTHARGQVVEAAYGDTGSAARFFYCAKASKSDRGEGNTHPTVKPTELMRYLCRLITPPNGIILDPFMGSGSTGVAALAEGFRFIGIDRDEASCEIAAKRLAQGVLSFEE
ncbi:MAG TPA: DNA methyltransferase [Blastocatellia bacterium]|nr:DNA methyltransferase [Blastocatellia bacterium]